MRGSTTRTRFTSLNGSAAARDGAPQLASEYIVELKRIALGEDATANARDRLSALKELLKLEPAASEQGVEFGSTWHVSPDRIVRGDETDAPHAKQGDDPGQP